MRDSGSRTLPLVEPNGRMDGLDNARHRVSSYQMFMDWNWRCGIQRGWAGKGPETGDGDTLRKLISYYHSESLEPGGEKSEQKQRNPVG